MKPMIELLKPMFESRKPTIVVFKHRLEVQTVIIRWLSVDKALFRTINIAYEIRKIVSPTFELSIAVVRSGKFENLLIFLKLY